MDNMDKKKQLLYHTGTKTVGVTIRAPKLSKYKISNVFKYIKGVTYKCLQILC